MCATDFTIGVAAEHARDFHDAFVGHALRKDYSPGQRWFFSEADLTMPAWASETDVRAGHFETQTISIGPSPCCRPRCVKRS